MADNVLAHDAVLFDFDGVLVDSEPVHYDCWNEILKPFGIRIEWDYYVRNCVGISDKSMIRTLVDAGNRPELFDEIYSLYPKKKDLFRERMIESPPMPEATRELIAGLDGLPIAVVTSSGRNEVAPILERVGLMPRFATAVYAEDVERLKPAPDPYLLAAKRLDATNPLVVEDSQAGIAAGLAAGFTVTRIAHPGEVAAKVRAQLRLG